jgi:hypothetical protein
LPKLVDLKLLKAKTAEKLGEWLRNFRDGIWDRIALGVARCSNIIERFHGIVRQAIRKAGVKKLHLRLEILKKVIIQRYDDYGKTWARQVETALNSLKDKNYKQRSVCNDPECHAYSEMMSIRLGLPPMSFPCAHTVRAYLKQAPVRPDLNDGDPADLTRVCTPNGEPIVETRSQVLERVRNRLCPRGGELHGEAKEAFERVERALTSPEAPREVPIETIVLEWDDEKGPTVGQEQWSTMEWYPVARHIVSGVYAMRDRVTRLPRLDKLAVAAAVFTHVAQELRDRHLPNDQAGKDAEEALMAQWTADWWHWAATDKNLPVGLAAAASLVRQPGQPDFIAEEEPIIRPAPDPHPE